MSRAKRYTMPVFDLAATGQRSDAQAHKGQRARCAFTATEQPSGTTPRTVTLSSLQRIGDKVTYAIDAAYLLIPRGSPRDITRQVPIL